MNSNRIRCLLHLRKINVKLMIYLIIAYIVKVCELFRTMNINLWHLPATETSGRLSLKCRCAHQKCKY